MSKRVYEIAQELDLSTREVLGRLNEAGLEIKSPLATVEDPLYKRVFSDGSDDDVPNGTLEGQAREVLPSMVEPRMKRLRLRRVLVFTLVAGLAFALAAGAGAMAALILGGNLSFTVSGKSQASGAQGNTHPEKKRGNAHEAKQSYARQSGVNYISKVGELQRESVKAFLDSHDKLLHYDALTADDIEQMQANEATLRDSIDQVGNLNPPQKYEEQYKEFRLALDELHKATQLAYTFASDPTTATASGFDEYDRHVSQAAIYLKKSNKMLGRDYKGIEGVQRIGP